MLYVGFNMYSLKVMQNRNKFKNIIYKFNFVLMEKNGKTCIFYINIMVYNTISSNTMYLFTALNKYLKMKMYLLIVLLHIYWHLVIVPIEIKYVKPMII